MVRSEAAFERIENTQYCLREREKAFERSSVLESRKLRELEWKVTGVHSGAPVTPLPLALSRAISGP